MPGRGKGGGLGVAPSVMVREPAVLAGAHSGQSSSTSSCSETLLKQPAACPAQPAWVVT